MQEKGTETLKEEGTPPHYSVDEKEVNHLFQCLDLDGRQRVGQTR